MTTRKSASGSSSTKKRKDSYTNALWITYLNIALYALCYQLQRPVEPFLVNRLSRQQLQLHDAEADAVAKTYGRLQSFFSAIQTLGSPLVGILLDRWGIRHTSALVFFASACSYAILATATTMPVLFCSKIPTALQHAFLVAQATAATVTRGGGDDSGAIRAQALSRMTTAYTLGATLGPALGGYLATSNVGDLYLSAKLAVVGSLISVLLSLLFLPNDNFVQSKEEEEWTAANEPQQRRSSSSSFLSDLKHSASIALRSPSLLPLLAVKVVGGVSASMYSTVMPMVLTQELRFSPATLGMIMSSGMLAVAAFGAFAMAPLSRWCSGGAAGLMRLGLCIRSALVLVMAYIIAHRGLLFGTFLQSNKRQWLQFQVIFTSVLYDLSSHALATGLTTQTTGIVNAGEQGALLGLEHGLFSLARVGGPPLGTYILTVVDHFSGVAMACGAIDLGLFALLSLCSSSSRLLARQGGGLRQERKSK